MNNGENIIYHYIQKTLLSNTENDDFNKELIERLILDLSIWIPKEIYQQLPILLPFVVRDSSSRRKQPDTGKDEWGFSNNEGYLRDDNSLIKGIIKPLFVDGRKVKEYNGKKLGKGFVASHIWRELQNGEKRLASTVPITNSFIPNLVWLPKQISKLTDREGSYAQKILKTISYKIYFNESPQSDLKNNVWNYLDNPNINFKSKVDINKLNYFKTPQKWVDKRKRDLSSEIRRILITLENKKPEEKRVKCSSYLPTLIERIDENKKTDFINWLEVYLKEIK
ncbi:hypothetical protein [Tenacibaculum haliotis]|uniref:hypothetical protein n=1 Tax=Tenacibaculum haliotis TaxID=1888914 RepID=UPI0021B07D15|nr:hypothetical protein [Tenacibaculum haliotis]MCT4697609.1 hypothetical protein [Tenacibaculum haliotis]